MMFNAIRTRELFVVSILAFAPASALAAQTILGSSPTPAECDGAVVALQRGDRSGWERLPSCGSAGGTALGAAIRAATLEVDPVYLGRLYTASVWIRDAAIFSAAITVMQDNGATQQSRVLAILIGIAQHDPNLIVPATRPWPTVLTPPSGGGVCQLTGAYGQRTFSSSSPLPSGYLQTLASATEATYRAATAPIAVKELARCVRLSFDDVLPITVSKTQILLTYMCGNRFRVRNTST